jgi:ABC-2 type transport system permease protein
MEASDRAIAESAKLALEEAGSLEGQSFVFGPRGASVVLMPQGPQVLEVKFGAGFPLSPVGRAMVRHVVERDAARRALGDAPLVTHEKTNPVVAGDAVALTRLAAMTMLWLMLTGSLGMLLQAVVRERANRALESLLASVRAWQIVAGKLLGVGAVSLLVLTAWGSTVVLLSLFVRMDSAFASILTGLSDPVTLARDVLIYVCAFAFYGATTVMLGALARDSASAQNAVRPMFVLLLAGFFVALASAGHPNSWPWLTYFPPFTPFLLLIKSSESVAGIAQVLLLGNLLIAAIVMFLLAARSLSVAPRKYHIFSWNIFRTQLMV